MACAVLLYAASLPARAQDAAAVAAWQVTRYDITANVPAAGAADRALNARALIAARNVGRATGRTFTVRVSPDTEMKGASVGNAPAQFTTREEARTKLRLFTVTLPAGVEPGGAVSVALEYRLPVGNNTGLAAVSPEGAQFLPLSRWYPTPNSEFSPRGADFAPARLVVNAADGLSIVSAGQATGSSFDLSLNAQPFFLAGKWDVAEGAGEARGISAWLVAGASAEERRRGEALVNLAAAARAFYAGLLGPAPEVPVRLVAVRRGAGFDSAGTLLLDVSAFRRAKVDAATAMLVGESVARLWVGGATKVGGEGAGVVREGLARYLATLFVEKQFGAEAAGAQRARIAAAYAPAARRDGPLTQVTPFSADYYTAIANRGALAWRLVAGASGRENFFAVLRRELEQNRGAGQVSLASLRAALGERGSESLRQLMAGVFDQPTDTDLLAGLPQQRGGEWVAALRNTGSLAADVTVAATTDAGQRLTANVTVPPKDFGEARFKTAARVVRIEIDPEKLYPQLDYSNDVAPRAPPPEESLGEIARQFAQQQYARAESLARELLRHYPAMQEARTWLGRALLEQNRLDEAEREFRAALEAPLPLATAVGWANVGLGEVHLRRRQAAEAARRFDEAARAEADFASTLAARLGRLRAEAAAGVTPPVDDSARAFVAQFDAAVQSGRKANIEALVSPGELADFTRGIVSNQPEAWQTRVLRTEPLGSRYVLVDAQVDAKILGAAQSGPAVLLLVRAGAGWRLAAVPGFEVRPKSDA